MKITEYREEYGKIEWQEGFAAELEGLTVEEQLRCYAFTTYAYLKNIPYYAVEEEIRREGCMPEEIECIADRWYAVVRDGIVVGFAYDNYAYNEDTLQWEYTGKKAVLPYGKYMYDSTSDNNGSGYKTREWYKYLICLPREHTLW